MAFREQYIHLREVEDSKNSMLENMLDEIERLNMTLKATEESLEREKDTSCLYFKRWKEHDVSLSNMQRATNSSLFVLILIDGDCMNFVDELINGCEAGGQEAAQRLRSSALEYVRSKIPDVGYEPKFVVQIHGNLKGLTKACCDAGIIHQREDLDRFIRGFNMNNALFNIIDAGNGKECSDSKIREVFKLHMGNLHCKHIIFGGSSDNGYARLLGPLGGDDTMRVTMLEGPPFAPELLRLTNKYKTTSFRNVFRDTKINEYRAQPHAPAPTLNGNHKSNAPSNQFTLAPTINGNPKINAPSVPPGLAFPSSAPVPLEFPLGSPPPSIAIHTKPPKSANPKSPQNGNQPHPVSESRVIPYGFTARNAEGQRIDPHLKASSATVNAIKPRKLCNNYHLRDFCTNPYCTYEHGNPLSPAESDALRFLARQVPCAESTYCEDPLCLFGHRCINGVKCNKYSCRFSDEMHGVDDKIADLYDGNARE